MNLALSSIRTDGGTQAREFCWQESIDDYAEAMTDGAVFPPVTAFFDGADYWLADGFHRLEAAAKAGRVEIEADVRPGSKRDAMLFACGANATHGRPRTNEDKRKAVEMLLCDKVCSGWTHREIARHCAVSHTTVDRAVKRLSGTKCQPDGGDPVTPSSPSGRGVQPDEPTPTFDFGETDDDPGEAEQGEPEEEAGEDDGGEWEKTTDGAWTWEDRPCRVLIGTEKTPTEETPEEERAAILAAARPASLGLRVPLLQVYSRPSIPEVRQLASTLIEHWAWEDRDELLRLLEEFSADEQVASIGSYPL